MIRHGVVVATPHYVTRSGPRSAVDPDLLAAWTGCDIRASIEARLGLPTLVLNDAEVHGAGVISGTGIELVLTLGTGLGSALFDGGKLAPHLELSHAPVRWGTSYDVYIGQVERARLGDGLWSRRVRRVVDGLRPVFWWDRLYLGGGNARQVTPQVLARLGDDVVVVPNQAGHRRRRARLVAGPLSQPTATRSSTSARASSSTRVNLAGCTRFTRCVAPGTTTSRPSRHAARNRRSSPRKWSRRPFTSQTGASTHVEVRAAASRSPSRAARRR